MIRSLSLLWLSLRGMFFCGMRMWSIKESIEVRVRLLYGLNLKYCCISVSCLLDINKICIFSL